MTLRADRGAVRDRPSSRTLRRPFGRSEVAILTGAAAAEFDRAAIDTLGIPGRVLIESAGRAAAEVVQHLRPDGPVVVFAGKGNNGADAVVVARTLASWGRSVSVVSMSRPLDGSLFHGWTVPVHELADAEAEVLSSAVVIDGVLGTGLRGRPRDPESLAIELINRAPGWVVALDVPSGVDADTAAVVGPAVTADLTIGFGSAKLGAVLFPGRQHTGRHVVVDIGFPPLIEAETSFITPGWVARRLPVRKPDAHKNSVGAVCVVGGQAGMAGAAVLAARASLRAGAGYVRVVTDPANRLIVQTSLPDAVFVDQGDADAVRAAVAASRAVLVGPGLGVEAAGADLLRLVLDTVEHHGAHAEPLRLILDADALTLLAQTTPPSSAVLTPHLGEMARLTGTPVDALKAAPLGAARALARAKDVTVLLKGSPTVVAESSGRGYVAASQSSDLAVAGMGDTLAGAIAALAAQGMAPAHAAAAALEVTARAAKLAGTGPGLLPTDVHEWLPAALDEREDGHTTLPFPSVLFDQDAPT